MLLSLALHCRHDTLLHSHVHTLLHGSEVGLYIPFRASTCRLLLLLLLLLLLQASFTLNQDTAHCRDP